MAILLKKYFFPFMIVVAVKGGFQLGFVSISRVVNHMTCYKFSVLIGWNYSIQTGEKILQRIYFRNQFSTNGFTFKFQLKTTFNRPQSWRGKCTFSIVLPFFLSSLKGFELRIYYSFNKCKTWCAKLFMIPVVEQLINKINKRKQIWYPNLIN